MIERKTFKCSACPTFAICHNVRTGLNLEPKIKTHFQQKKKNKKKTSPKLPTTKIHQLIHLSHSVSQKKKKEQTIKEFEDENSCFHYIFCVNTDYIIFTLLALPLDRLTLVFLSISASPCEQAIHTNLSTYLLSSQVFFPHQTYFLSNITKITLRKEFTI